MRPRHSTAADHLHRHADLLEELGHANLLQGNDRIDAWSNIQLHARLQRCAGPQWGRRWTCRCPSCPGCRDRYIGAQRRSAQKAFADVPNEQLAMITVVIGATDCTWEIGNLVAKARRDMRNMIARQRKSSPDWAEVEVMGWLETDAFDKGDYPALGSDKQKQYGEFITICDGETGVVWVPSIHGIIRIPASLDIADVQAAVAHQWRGHRQTDVQTFASDKSRALNISHIVNYANKHECLTGPTGTQVPWDKAWLVAYYSWTHAWSRGFHSLSFRVNPSTSTTPPSQPSCADHIVCSSTDFIVSGMLLDTGPAYSALDAETKTEAEETDLVGIFPSHLNQGPAAQTDRRVVSLPP